MQQSYSAKVNPSYNPSDTHLLLQRIDEHFLRSRCVLYCGVVGNCEVLLCFSDGELYTGTVADYRGNWPVISRHLSEGRRVDLKLDDTLGWLEGERVVSQ